MWAVQRLVINTDQWLQEEGRAAGVVGNWHGPCIVQGPRWGMHSFDGVTLFSHWTLFDEFVGFGSVSIITTTTTNRLLTHPGPRARVVN